MKEPGKKLFRKSIYLLIAAFTMFILGWLVNKYLVRTTSVIYYSKVIEARIQEKEKDFLELTRDTALLQSLVTGSYSDKTLSTLLFSRKSYGIFVYDRDTTYDHQLRFWNTQDITPSTVWEDRDTTGLINLSSGKFVHINKTIQLPDQRSYTVEALIPVLTSYFVQNANFRREFADYPGAEKLVDISPQPTNYPIKSVKGQTLFHLTELKIDGRQNNWWSFIFVLAGIFILIIYIHQESSYIYKNYGLWSGASFMCLCILLLRLLTYYYPNFLNLRQFELFDPAIYGSSFVLSSLGDLLINALLCSWLMLFMNRRINTFSIRPFREKWKNWLTVTILLTIMVAATFTFADILQSLVADAKISFNVINIDNINRYSFIGFTILASLALSYFFLAQILLTVCGKLIYGNYYTSLIISASVGLIILTFTRNTGVVELNLYVLLWLLLFLMMIQQQLFSGLRFRLNVSEVLFWLFVFSFSIAAVIIFENRKKEFEQRKRFAEKLSLQNDPSGGKLLSIAFAYLDNNFLYPNFERFKDGNQNAYLKDSIINKFFTAYADRYDTKIYVYDDYYKPLFNTEPVSFDTLNTIFTIQSKKTDMQDVAFYEKSFDQVSYLIRKEVRDKDSTAVGYFFVVAEPKKYKSDALVPELFQSSKELVPDYTQGYSYAVYIGRRLSTYYSDFPFPTYLESSELPKTEFEVKKDKNFEVLWYKGSSNSTIIIAKKNVAFLEAITLFSYLFTTFLFLLAFYRIGAGIVRSRLKWSNLKTYWEFSIRSQIHSTIIMVSLLSFLVIGVATILFFINRYDRDRKDSLSRTSKIMVNELQNRFNKEEEGVINAMMLYSDSSRADLEVLMSEITEIHGTDVNFYDTLGNLKLFSNPLIYKKGVLSEKMNPEAFFQLRHMRAIQVVTEEKIGRTEFMSIYCPIRDMDGRAYAYLNVPSFRTQGELTQEISNFLVTVINLNAFIFLVAGAIALVITNRITSSFTIIGQKMRDINLNKLNQEIHWRRKDEIGELVNEYNKMVHKLDQSADALAKSEREGAWRQMARQVAHEIKNPLTPMKLSIQYLQKAIDNNSPNVKEMTRNVANTLVEQIDHLSKIASDFSQFANIGNPRSEVFDLHDLLSSLTLLYESTDNLEFSWEKADQRLMMLADKTQLNRLFTNLMQNAVEACQNKERILINVSEKVEGEYVLLSVSDNGEGIPEHIQSKIFTPNFTTKTSGTGLGLAMSKSIAEQAQGDLWFETSETGTTFYVKLPLLGVV
ncbi:MAG: HAMP domain-containing histidine kinase [Chitinophagaceae bacterium]|nr:MAG: HAMP domain-containing histidine kinase [Chitinophagaceae bacterium]